MQSRLNDCGARMISWGGEKFPKFDGHIQELPHEETRKLRGLTDGDSLSRFNVLDKELQTLQNKEDAY